LARRDWENAINEVPHVTLGLMVALVTSNIGTADEGAAKKVCVIEDPPGTIIQQIDAPNGSSAGAYCVDQVQKFLKSNPNAFPEASVRLACFYSGDTPLDGWTA
jgi:hypothetical protein